MNPLTQALSVACAALALIAGVFIYLYQGEVRAYSDFKSAVVAAQQQAEEQAELERARQERLLADYGQRWSAALADRPVIRVRDSGGCLKPVPALSATAGGTEELPASSGEGWISVEQCEQIASDSILDARWIEAVKALTDELHGVGK